MQEVFLRKEGLVIKIQIKNLSLLGVDQVVRAIIEELSWMFLLGTCFFFPWMNPTMKGQIYIIFCKNTSDERKIYY